MTPTRTRRTPRRATLAAAALAASLAAATAIAPPAGAATPAKVTGAYLFISTIDLGNKTQRYATLVFRTDAQLPRRFDGLIRASAGVAGQNASVSSVKGKASRCYQVNVRIRPDNTITGSDGSGGLTHTKARAGSRLPVQITAGTGAEPVERTLTLRAARTGDASGAPLRC